MGAAPGWHADPGQPGMLRWWDGAQWTEYRAPAAPIAYGGGTDGYAIASLITAVLGIPVVPIVLGMKARTRIRESFGMKDGDGLAIAGIVIGWIQVAIFVIVTVVIIAAAASTP